MALTRLGLNQAVNLASNVTGTLPTANGGTGATSFSPGKILQMQNNLMKTTIVILWKKIYTLMLRIQMKLELFLNQTGILKITNTKA